MFLPRTYKEKQLRKQKVCLVQPSKKTMLVLILQSALLLAIAYILGCIIGCLLRTLMGGNEAASPAPVVAAAAATAAVAVPKPAPAPKPVPKPEPVKAPEPVALVSPAPVKKATPKPKPKPKAKPKPKPRPKKPAAPKTPDDLKLIRGIGRQNEARLNALGVNRFDQIGKWTKKDAADWGNRLAFPGRIEREEWIPQAKKLAAGKATEFSKRVKSGSVSSSVGKGTVGSLGKKPRTMAKARASGADNLTLIDGVGNAIEKRLFDLGIYHFDQIAKWTKDNCVWAGNEVGFPGRPERENWVEEAKILASGGMTAHAKKVESGAIKSSRKSTPKKKK
ncbi:putative 22 protein in nqo2 3'region [Nymphon striatum]|nr:putative 22 protein in nqo2 3'region [Nymphon striatum]